MKKTKSIILAMSAVVCLAISGCGGYTTVTADPSEVAAQQAEEKKEEAAAAATAQAEVAAKAEEAAPEKEGSTDEAAPAPSTATEPAKEKKTDDTVRSILTNKKIDPEVKKQRPLAVMYPINYEAQPQYGLNKVDVFYEMIEEGNMSRQMGIIQDWQGLDMIGNIRSTRAYFCVEAMRYDPIMIHFGGPVDCLQWVTDREDFDNLNGVGGVLGGDYGAFFRVNNGKATEHTAYTSADNIKNACALAGYSLENRPEYYKEHQFDFADPDNRNTLEQYTDSIPATNIDMSGAYPVTQSSLVYNEEDHKYYKYLYGEPQCDAVTGKQMSFSNVIIQEAKFEYRGNHGYVDLDTVSHGRNAYIFTEGRCVPVKWERKGIHEPTTYYHDGEVVNVNTGRTMIFIIRDHLDTFAIDGTSYATQGKPFTPAYSGE